MTVDQIRSLGGGVFPILHPSAETIGHVWLMTHVQLMHKQTRRIVHVIQIAPYHPDLKDCVLTREHEPIWIRADELEEIRPARVSIF